MKNHYLSLAVQSLASGLIMYLAMFSMIDSRSSFYNNLNTFYMTLMMVAPMVAIMVAAMWHMFHSKKANVALLAGAAAVSLAAWALIRTQTTIDDRAFLRSMIPHHAGAILMCQEASLTDPQVQRLCGEIIRSQRAEIEEMKDILTRL